MAVTDVKSILIFVHFGKKSTYGAIKLHTNLKPINKHPPVDSTCIYIYISVSILRNPITANESHFDLGSSLDQTHSNLFIANRYLCDSRPHKAAVNKTSAKATQAARNGWLFGRPSQTRLRRDAADTVSRASGVAINQ